MTKFNYYKLSKAKKIRYLKLYQKNCDYIVFLHGFMSDLNGKKPRSFLKFAKKNKLGFLALEYSGHGKSSGKFTKGNISKWTKETSILIKKIVKTNKIIFIGSSMGAWIALNQFKIFKKQIKGFLGIGSAPEFLENLMWKKFSKKMKAETIKNRIYNLKHGDYIYPITLQINVTMVHGQKDEVVPVSYSKKVLKIFKNSRKKLVIIKNGDHSLSSPKHLKMLKKELKLIIN